MLKKRTFVIALLLLLVGGMPVSAQNEGGDENKVKIISGWGVSAHSRYKDIRPLALDLNLGLEFAKRFYVFASNEDYLGLYRADGEKNYFNTYNLGGGISYSLINKAKDSNGNLHSLAVKGSVTTSVGNTDWKNTAYTAGLYYRIAHVSAIGAPRIGIGYRYLKSRTTGISDYSGPFVSVGFGY